METTSVSGDPSGADHDEFASRLLESQRGIYALLVALLPHERDLDDLFQRVCLTLWRERAKYDPQRPFLPWAAAFVRNIGREYLRAAGRQKGLIFSSDVLERIAIARGDYEAGAEARRAALDACVEKLHPRQIELLRARYESHGSLTEVAREMKVSAASLTMRLQRIRHALLKCVEQTLAKPGAT